MTYAREEALDALACGALPRQGKWSDEDYLWLTDETNRLVEFTDGFVEALPMPTSTHQTVLAYLFDCFREHVKPRGKVLFAALRVRIRQGKFREPDLLVLQDRDDPRFQDRFWLRADVVVEVVGPRAVAVISCRSRSIMTKRAFRNTGSSILGTRRSQCSRSMAMRTPNTACPSGAARLPRHSCRASKSTWAPSSTRKALGSSSGTSAP